MNMRLFVAILLLVLAGNCARSQELNIDGLPIKVCQDQFSIVTFPDDVSSTFAGCAAGNYKITYAGNRLSIKPNVEKPTSPCNLIVEEGSGDEKRTHRLCIIFVPGKDAVSQDESYTNLSTKNLLHKCIDELETNKAAIKQKKTAPQTAPPQQAETQAAGEQQAQQTTAQPKPADQAPAATKLGEDEIEIGGLVISKSDYKKKVDFRLKQFSETITALGDTSYDLSRALEYGMKLFKNDEDRTVEISRSSGTSTSKIRKYLTKIRQLKFTSIHVTNSTTQFLSGLHQNQDGSYWGHVVYVQKFTGYRGEKAVYTDVTEKTAEVQLVIIDRMEDGVLKKKWEVYLGNISVNQP
jgi:hypothetical protein